MKRTAKHIAAVLLLCTLTITGCSKSVSEDSYIAGTDFQYQYYDRSLFTTVMARGTDAMYFAADSFIYQLDEGTGTLAPLCNKPNCLHDKETDKNRKPECNAYITTDTSITGITYMNGCIYSIMREWADDGSCDTLYKIAGDGSAKEKAYQWEGGIVEGWCIHRDVLYYVEHTYDEDNEEHYAVKAMKLSGMGKRKAETIWKPDENVAVLSLLTPQAYGNHLYITINGLKGADLEALKLEEDFIKHSYNKTFQYNLQDKTLSEIQTPNQSDMQHVSEVTFWQDKIVYQAFDLENRHTYDTVTDVYIADLDGSNAKTLFKDMPLYRWYTSDGTYLYVSNCGECLDKIFHSDAYKENINDLSNMQYDFKMQVDVYDHNMELVDTMEPPFHTFPTEPVYGIGDRMYVQTADESGVSLEYWDKTKIGTYHGSEYQLTKAGIIGE